jgi:hypothetical protein
VPNMCQTVTADSGRDRYTKKFAMPTDLFPDTPAPPDATELFSWTQRGPDLATRVFCGAVREAAGFAVRIEGFQRENRTCHCWLAIVGTTVQTRLEPEAARQLAAALTAAASEIEALR